MCHWGRPPILPRHVRVKRRSRIKSLPPRSQGLDVLVAGVRDQGFSAATARKAVLAFRGEAVELITPTFKNLRRLGPGQPPKARRRKRKAARPEPAPPVRTPTAEVKREPVSVADIQ